MADIWREWQFEPDIVAGTLLVAGLYAAGLWRRLHKAGRWRRLRHASFVGGLAAIFLALESPLDALADHLFCAHQVQHLLLLMVGPMLIVLAAPQALLIAGIPTRVRPYLLAPLAASPAVRAVFRFLSHPVVATLAMGGTLYVWQIPEVHDTTVLNERLHYVMHVTMLSSGLFFWWRVLDLRPPPVGLPYLYRLGMLKVAFMMETFLGAYLTSKEVVLYDVYDQLGLRGMTSLRDEMLGGMVLWVAGGLILMLGGLVVTVWWVREDRAHAAGSPPIARSALASGGLQPYSRLEGRGAV